MSTAEWKSYVREHSGTIETIDGAPVLRAFPLPNQRDTVGLYCEHCQRFHYHGAVEGSRVAHCAKPSPFTKTGYVLRIEKKVGA